MGHDIDKILGTLELGDDGVYSSSFVNQEQSEEVIAREAVSSKKHMNYMKEIARHHSVPVMDGEVKRFIKKIPAGGVIVDVGGCWGWHWRNLSSLRPDIKVVIVDFIRSSLHHAVNLLGGDVIGKSVFLVHGDALDLPFPDGSFDGYWSVQVLQHIEKIEVALKESHRVLAGNGNLSAYFLNYQKWTEILYKALGKKYHVSGKIDDLYYLSRATEKERALIQKIFNTTVTTRYSEALFQPELKMRLSGGSHSLLGKFDRTLSGSNNLLRYIARQRSFHATKKKINELVS